MNYPESIGPRPDFKITRIELDHRQKSQQAREMLARQHYNPEQVIRDNKEMLGRLAETPFRNIGQKLVKGDSLGFEDSFLGMTFVVASTNIGVFEELKPAFEQAHGITNLKQEQLIGPAQAFLTGMALKESAFKLDETEIAGMVAAGMMDVMMRFEIKPYVLETGGMGGDKGFTVDGQKRKVINASTLSSIVLAALDVPVIKHGSYANTSAVGSTEAIEELGINIFPTSQKDIADMFNELHFHFSDAHVVKTLHDLSHSDFMKHETINHVIGPMTPPVHKDTVLHKVIGVNDGVHPSLIAKAYQILNERGYQTMGNVLVISGLDEAFPEGEVNIHDAQAMKPFMMLDEVSPYKTLVSIVQHGVYMGEAIISQEDFGTRILPSEIQFANTSQSLLQANASALRGDSEANSNYLAANAALGLFTVEYLGREDAFVDGKLNRNYLQEAFQRCRETIFSGKANEHKNKLIAASVASLKEKKTAPSLLENVDAVIFDIDDTLVKPKNPSFYKKFSEAVNTAVAEHYGVSYDDGVQIADYFRQHPDYGGGEYALFTDIQAHFPGLVGSGSGFTRLYDAMSAIDPSGEYEPHLHVIEKLKILKEKGVRIAALTDSPEGLSRKILLEAGINPDELFDIYIAGSREEGPHKLLRGEQKFAEIAERFGIPKERILAVGDSHQKDILPAQRLGMKTCYVGTQRIADPSCDMISTIEEVFQKMQL